MTSSLTRVLSGEVPLALKGEKCPNAKFTLEEVEDIKTSSLSRKELSNKYNISQSRISNIIRGETWNDKPPKFAGSHKDIFTRFWDRVDKSGDCWEWTGAKNKYGYGMLPYGPRKARKSFGAHRVSYEIHFGVIPDGLLVLHKCDNKSCVNPAHLELGNQSKNVQDAYDRGLIKRRKVK